ncbi:MAG: mechanosensitive ion channel family protein [Leptolyngbyaceae cyanobacterium]
MIQSATALGQDFSAFGNTVTGTLPPDGVSRYGSIETTLVRSPLDGEELFQIAAPTVIDRSNPDAENLPVEIRARNVEALLRIELERFGKNVFERIANQLRLWDADWSPPRSAQVIISTLNNRPVIQIRSSDRSRPLTIITVTQTDVDFYSETPEVLSQEWRDILQEEIDQFEQLASVERARQGLWRSCLIFIGVVSTTGILVFLHWWMGQKYRHLLLQNQSETTVEADQDAAPQFDATHSPSENKGSSVNGPLSPDSHRPEESHPPDASRSSITPSGLLAERSRFLKLLQKRPTLERKLNLLELCQWLLIWAVVFAGYCGLIGLTFTLPMFMSWRNALLSEPFRILLIWFVVNLALWLNRTLIHRYTSARQSLAIPYSSSEAQRKSLRINTIGGVLEGFVSVLIILTGLLLTLSIFGLDTRSVLAWGAVLGLAISFGTQSLIKDVVNGCLILLEDQFAVGDVISIKNMAGLVEEMSLRSTRLRNPEGQLITIPNGNIAEVSNLTRLWSRVDFTIEVAYDNDPDKVLAVLNEVAQRLYSTPDWSAKMPGPPEVLGIDHLSHSGMLIRVWLQTAPLQQWLVGREYRLRVRKAFAAHNITIGKPQWISHTAALEPSSTHNGLISCQQF